MEKIKAKVEGMSCTSCAINIEKAIKEIEGVIDVKVDFSLKKAIITTNKTIPFEKLTSKVKEAGYELLPEGHEDEELTYLKKERKRLILSWVLTLPLLIKMSLAMLFGIMIHKEILDISIDLILSFFIIFILGFDIIKATFYAIRKFSFTMDSLIGIGTIASFITGLLKLSNILMISNIKIEDFSMIGAMIMSINHIGTYLKQLSTGKASLAIKKLMQLGAKNAHKIINNSITDNDLTENNLVKNELNENYIIDVDVSELSIGDIVLVKPGEKIPSDGVIIEGSCTIDESIATGESKPVDKKVGDNVIGATINQDGDIKVKIEKIGKDTFLSQIISMVEQAQASKVPIQQFADKVTGYFVPLIIGLSILTFLAWFLFPGPLSKFSQKISGILPWMIIIAKDRITMAIFASIATLVIACPCALGLATPTALMVGMGKAALNGVLIRKGEAIQRMKEVTTVIFDKTGTITEGRPIVTDILMEKSKNIFDNNLDNKSKNQLKNNIKDNTDLFLSYSYSLESLSDHPLAKAITDWIKNDKKDIEQVKVESFSYFAGNGIKALIDGKTAICGSISFLEKENVKISDTIKNKINEFIQQGKTIVGTSYDGILLGTFAISDKIKADAKEVIEKLHKLNLKTIMLTGDNKLAANFIANKAGINNFYANLLPKDKINIVKKLQNKGEVVAMVGDGINDAPALKQADVGIAIAASDIAIEAADITIPSNNLFGVYKSFIISQKTFQKIKQNLFWAFFYNIIAIPLAMLGLLHPIIAEIAMATSSISVVLNSLRLNRIKLE